MNNSEPLANSALVGDYSEIREHQLQETKMVFVDGKMDRYEHYLMNKLKNLLRLSQDQLINAKLKVLHPS